MARATPTPEILMMSTKRQATTMLGGIGATTWRSPYANGEPSAMCPRLISYGCHTIALFDTPRNNMDARSEDYRRNDDDGCSMSTRNQQKNESRGSNTLDSERRRTEAMSTRTYQQNYGRGSEAPGESDRHASVPIMTARSLLKSSKFDKIKANLSNHLGLLDEGNQTGKSTEVELLVKEVTRRVHHM